MNLWYMVVPSRLTKIPALFKTESRVRPDEESTHVPHKMEQLRGFKIVRTCRFCIFSRVTSNCSWICWFMIIWQNIHLVQMDVRLIFYKSPFININIIILCLVCDRQCFLFVSAMTNAGVIYCSWTCQWKWWYFVERLGPVFFWASWREGCTRKVGGNWLFLGCIGDAILPIYVNLSNYSDLTRPGPPKCSWGREIPLFQGNLGWWKL